MLDQEILREATKQLIRKEGGLFVATGALRTQIRGLSVWLITVTLRYPTGFEGYVGDLLYDGKDFQFLTEPSLIDERVRQIDADPEGIRQWNEYRATTSLAASRWPRKSVPSPPVLRGRGLG